MDELDPTFDQIKRDLDGQLSVPVYRRLHEAARGAGGGVFVEVGTARGAATAALALGARAGGTPFHIYTVDGFEGRVAPRWRGRSTAENIALLRDGLAGVGVAEDISIVAGTAAELVAAHDPRDIRLLLIDADGRVDRDFDILLDRLAPDALVIVDDMDDQIYVHWRDDKIRIDLKHRTTHLLVAALIEQDILRLETVVENTGFYVRGPGRLDQAKWRLAVVAAYRQLVFTDLDPSLVGVGVRAGARRWMERHAPLPLALSRRLRGLG